MAKTRVQKEALLQELRDYFSRAKSTIFVQVNRVSVNDINDFRSKCHDKDVKYLVAKKTLLSLIAKETELPFSKEALDGQVSVVFGFRDEVTPAKLVAEFGKTHDAVSFVGGILDRKFFSREDMIALAKLPSREELLAKLVFTFNASISGMVNVLSGPIRGFTVALNHIAESKN